MNNWDKLLEYIKPNRYLTPTHHGKEIIKITCKNGFEGHGRASETWEEHWYLELCQEQYYWRTNKNVLRMGNEGITQRFHGRTFNDVVAKAVRWYKTPKEVNNEHR